MDLRVVNFLSGNWLLHGRIHTLDWTTGLNFLFLYALLTGFTLLFWLIHDTQYVADCNGLEIRIRNCLPIE